MGSKVLGAHRMHKVMITLPNKNGCSININCVAMTKVLSRAHGLDKVPIGTFLYQERPSLQDHLHWRGTHPWVLWRSAMLTNVPGISSYYTDCMHIWHQKLGCQGDSALPSSPKRSKEQPRVRLSLVVQVKKYCCAFSYCMSIKLDMALKTVSDVESDVLLAQTLPWAS
jgi:hypothetical protein